MITPALALALALATNMTPAPATDAACPPAPGFTLHALTHAGPDGAPVEYRYAIYRPYDLPVGEPAPALLFLHGRGECGTDGTRHLAVGLPREIVWSSDRWPMVVVMPQKPTQESEWEDHAPAVLAILDRAVAQQGIDPARVAITGLSQGGHGTIWFAAHHPGRFVAAAPVCGYVARRFGPDGQRIDMTPAQDERSPTAATAAALAGAGLPVWLLHGRADEVIPASESIALHEALLAAGVEARLSLFEGVGHNAWDHAYPDPALAAWLREHTAAR